MKHLNQYQLCRVTKLDKTQFPYIPIAHMLDGMWPLWPCLPPLGEGKKERWFTHALNHPNIPGIGIFSVHVCVMMTSLVGVSTCCIHKALAVGGKVNGSDSSTVWIVRFLVCSRRSVSRVLFWSHMVHGRCIWSCSHRWTRGTVIVCHGVHTHLTYNYVVQHTPPDGIRGLHVLIKRMCKQSTRLFFSPPPKSLGTRLYSSQRHK